MKKIMETIGLFTLIVFSFFYSDKVMNVIKEQDTIMIKLKETKDNYSIKSTNAIINEDTIIPGINGRKVNIDKSYQNMKEIGVFDKNNIAYDEFSPNTTIKNNLDKYIIKGNDQKNKVSIIIILNNEIYNKELLNTIKNRQVIMNLFVDYNYLNENISFLNKLTNQEIYSYGNNGKYTPDNILFSNNIIKNISSNNPNYCLVKEKNKKTLSLCSSNNMYTILPNIQGNYTNIKDYISNGSMILLESNMQTMNELNIIIDFIRSKGYSIVGLSSLLSENL